MTRAARVAGVTLVALWLSVPLLPIPIWAAAERWTFPAALPQSWGSQGWLDALDSGLAGAMWRSFLLGVAVAAIATPLGVLTGRVLGWRLTRRPWLVVSVLLVPLVLPPFAVSMGLDVVLIRLGIPELVAVVVLLAVVATPYTAYTCAVGFARLSPEVEEQARALGATVRQARLRVVLPAARRSILIAALLAFLVGWSDYVVTLLVGGGQLLTAPILLGSAASGSGNDPAVAALTIATLLPPVLLVSTAAWLQRHRPAARRPSPSPMPASERIRP
ncbi:MAG: ABC transporter permease subunit [Nocardioides sp.]